MSGMMNPYPGKLGVIQEGAYADILLVDGNPLKDISVPGASDKFIVHETPPPIDTIKLIMKGGEIYKDILPSTQLNSILQYIPHIKNEEFNLPPEI